MQHHLKAAQFKAKFGFRLWFQNLCGFFKDYFVSFLSAIYVFGF